MDYTDRLEVSPLTLYRVKGLPDADDTYLLSTFSNHYGHGKPLILIDSKSEISEKKPADPILIYNTIPDTLMVSRSSSGDIRVITPFVENGIEKYRHEPLVIDPGDHWYLVE